MEEQPSFHNRIALYTDIWRARRADALVLMAESWLSGGSKSSSTGDRYQVQVHVEADTPAIHHPPFPPLCAER